MAKKFINTCVDCGYKKEKPYLLDTYVCFNCRIKREKANRKAREGSWTIRKRKIKEAGGNICSKCGQESDKVILHHIEPIALGGPTSSENTILLCSECHKEAHANLKIKGRGIKLPL